MDPQTYPILMPLSKMIDELRKRIVEVNAKHQCKASALPADPQTIDGKSDIYGLKATQAVLMKEVKMMRDDWLKAMESLYAVQECLLALCCLASPSDPNLTPPQNVHGGFGLRVLLMKMKEDLGQRIAEEKMAQLAEVSVAAVVPEVADEIADVDAVVPEVADEIADVDALISENTSLKAQLETLGDNWLSMNAAFFAFVKNLVDIGLIMGAPTEGNYPSQG